MDESLITEVFRWKLAFLKNSFGELRPAKRTMEIWLAYLEMKSNGAFSK